MGAHKGMPGSVKPVQSLDYFGPTANQYFLRINTSKYVICEHPRHFQEVKQLL